MIDRRTFIGASVLLAGGFGSASPAQRRNSGADLSARFEDIRLGLGRGARLGVAALETRSRRRLLHDANSRYSMASTFKLPLAGAVLALAEKGTLSLNEELAFDPGDPLDNSPVVAANFGRGRLAVGQLAAAIVQRSDNSAANLLLRRIGGPAALTRFLRRIGDPVTRLDRYEMALNSNLPGDPRDTTSPAAMAATAAKLVTGNVLKPASRAKLAEWLKTAQPGPDRLPAGLPNGWIAGHKTGTGARGAHNDVAIVWAPARAPVVIASYQSGGTAPPETRAAAHAAVARLVAQAWA